METIRDAVSVAVTVAIQIGMPVTILFLIGYRRHRADRWRQPQFGEQPTSIGSIGIAATRKLPHQRQVECWASRQCPPEKRASCPARSRTEIPCWKAMKLSLGRLQADCLDCERFLTPPARGRQP
ncbi:MAG: hypothetical protein ACYC66_02610 [Chloroflexota bacterium]